MDFSAVYGSVAEQDRLISGSWIQVVKNQTKLLKLKPKKTIKITRTSCKKNILHFLIKITKQIIFWRNIFFKG